MRSRAGAPHAGGGANGEAGFTLLEILVAVLILSALISIVPRSLVAARGNLERSKDWLAARLVAETVLSEGLVGTTLRPGVLSGTIDGHRWTATLRPVETKIDPKAPPQRPLLDVHLSVAVSGKSVLEIDTLRIGSGS